MVPQPSGPDGLLPNALKQIIALVQSHLALSLADLAVLFGITTKSFKFMALLSLGLSILNLFSPCLFCKGITNRKTMKLAMMYSQV